jgi:hypothetical protein
MLFITKMVDSAFLERLKQSLKKQIEKREGGAQEIETPAAIEQQINHESEETSDEAEEITAATPKKRRRGKKVIGQEVITESGKLLLKD